VNVSDFTPAYIFIKTTKILLEKSFFIHEMVLVFFSVLKTHQFTQVKKCVLLMKAFSRFSSSLNKNNLTVSVIKMFNNIENDLNF